MANVATANIRTQCARVTADKSQATRKGRSLIAARIVRVARQDDLEPRFMECLTGSSPPITPRSATCRSRARAGDRRSAARNADPPLHRGRARHHDQRQPGGRSGGQQCGDVHVHRAGREAAHPERKSRRRQVEHGRDGVPGVWPVPFLRDARLARRDAAGSEPARSSRCTPIARRSRPTSKNGAGSPGRCWSASSTTARTGWPPSSPDAGCRVRNAADEGRGRRSRGPRGMS
jgi:hypothetical protein